MWFNTCHSNGVATHTTCTHAQAYSPLGRGFLTGDVDKSKMDKFDFRVTNPRFADGYDHNMSLVKKVEALAARKGCTVGQLSLAWLHAQGDDVIPIPGNLHPKIYSLVFSPDI